jgi:hypothetical protein
MSDECQLPSAQPAPELAPEEKKVKKARVAKIAVPVQQGEGPRQWADVVPKIREMKEAGATVPEIAEALELSYVLVNQVMLQSYKMSVDTIGVFERQERMRLGLG